MRAPPGWLPNGCSIFNLQYAYKRTVSIAGKEVHQTYRRVARQRVRYALKIPYRAYSSDYGAVVVGSGPAGLAAVGNLLENKMSGKTLWVAEDHTAGKVDTHWREVPSNTKVKLFLDYAKALASFRRVIDSTPKPNAITALEDLDQNTQCQLSYAADMIKMLGEGLRQNDQVQGQTGTITGANWDSNSSTWAVEYRAPQSSTRKTISASRMVLAIGSTPTEIPLPVPGLTIRRIDLETTLQPSELARALPKSDPATTVAVIGGSHSAILVLMNLYHLATSTHPRLRVRWFTRSSLLYAEEKDGWILYDNTGLKGSAAEFARENLEDEKLPTSPVGKVISKVDCSGGHLAEKDAYALNLPGCTHLVSATGFKANPMPTLAADGRPLLELAYDHERGGFTDKEGRRIPGLYGTGIAFPERVTDPVGNVELSVGMFKFQKYLKRVVPEWLKA